MSTKLAPASLWSALRTGGLDQLNEIAIRATAPDDVDIIFIEHVRTAHYAVYRVYEASGESWIARVGVVAPEDTSPADNSGYLSTSAVSPSGQMREYEVASGFAAMNADVCVPKHYARTPEGLDVLWLPFIESVSAPLNAAQWHRALKSLHSYQPQNEAPMFTNRAKTLARLDEIEDGQSGWLREQYDYQLKAFFSVSTQWSMVHGDAHAGNAINTGKHAVLFDFDTSCWAPSVWDLTHLMNRAGTDGNTGYTAEELRSLFSFTDTEIDAALTLRRTAALIAKVHRSNQQ